MALLEQIRRPGFLPPAEQRVVTFNHAPVDADFKHLPPDGTILVIDTATPALWSRIGGAWKKAVLV